jgi:hypothetical protein
LSLQETLPAFGVKPQLPLLVLQVPSLQASPAQLFGAPGWHKPPAHASPTVQGLLSLQVAVLFWCKQPWALSQESLVQPLPSSQAFALPPVHWPDELHVSPTVQKRLSLQAAPVLIGLEHAPVLGLHVPTLWHWSSAVHTTELLPVHVPF